MLQEIGSLSDIRWFLWYGGWSEFSLSGRYLKNIFVSFEYSKTRRFTGRRNKIISQRQLKLSKFKPVKELITLLKSFSKKNSCERKEWQEIIQDIKTNYWPYKRYFLRIPCEMQEFLWAWRYHRKDIEITRIICLISYCQIEWILQKNEECWDNGQIVIEVSENFN